MASVFAIALGLSPVALIVAMVVLIARRQRRAAAITGVLAVVLYAVLLLGIRIWHVVTGQ